MWFIIHVITVVVTLLSIFGSEAKPQGNSCADKDWSDINKGCIRNNNYQVVGRPTIDSCKEKCVNEDGINCQSIEYNPERQICGISEARSNSEHFMETCYEEGWEYTERIQAAGQTSNGGGSCCDVDRTCSYLADIGECQKHTSFMKNNCKKSCNYCPSGTKDLCSEMNGTCVESGDNCIASQAMKIYNDIAPQITKKYCAISEPESPACCAPSGQVFTVDMENSLAFIFENTLIYRTWGIPNDIRVYVDYTSSPARDHLLGFLGILKKYIKAPDHIHSHTEQFILNVGNYVQGINCFNASDLQREFIKIQHRRDDAYLSAWQSSVSCHNTHEGSCYIKPYIAACGLWNMFHTMTVAAAEPNAANTRAKPLEVIDAINGFVSSFASCGHCRYHFLSMHNQTIGTYPDRVDTLDKAILWLWCAHNSVNQEWTARNDTFWPPHPVFPLSLACPGCWTKSPDVEYTNCSALFCEGHHGPNTCFEATFLNHTYPITYGNFSKLGVLTYLKNVYSGPYSKLNSEDTPLTFSENIKCPKLR